MPYNTVKKNRNIRKKIRNTVIVIGLLIILFKTAIYSTLTFYDISQGVNSIKLEDKILQEQIDKFILSNQDCSIKQLIKESLKITSNELEFSNNSKTTNPNELRLHPKTHCVGYASMTNSLINYGLDKLNKSAYQSNHWKGKIFILGIEITGRTGNPFFQDHDYVEITNARENIRLRVDPSLYEFSRIGIMNIKYAK